MPAGILLDYLVTHIGMGWGGDCNGNGFSNTSVGFRSFDTVELLRWWECVVEGEKGNKKKVDNSIFDTDNKSSKG